MSKRHFIALAERLRGVRPIASGNTGVVTDAYAQWCATVRAVADFCAAQNGRFDRARFLAACGLED